MKSIKTSSNLICAITVTYFPDQEVLDNITITNSQVDFHIIIDNTPDKSSYSLLKKVQSEKAKVIFNEKNLGIAKALNQGVTYAIENKFDWVLTMDQDSKLSPKKNFNLKTSLLNQVIEKNLFNISLVGNPASKNSLDYVNYVITSGNLVSTKIFKEVGNFDENLFIDCVDTDFCFRVIRNNYRIVRLNNIDFNHALGELVKVNFFGKKILYNKHSPIREYYIARNYIHLFFKHFTYFPTDLIYLAFHNLKNYTKIILFDDQRWIKLKMIIKGLIAALVKF